MKAYAVIGMNYGDEGKGHIINFLSDSETLNIRFNGGGQASHAVNLADGRSHVFHHFGSGSLRGARTLLASHFILNPLIFMKELGLLKDAAPREVLIDPRCRVTTPYDMLVNEFSVKYKKKNDTCGCGINETVERSIFRQLKITARDLLEKSEAQLMKILLMIEGEHLPWRLDKLGLPKEEFKKFAMEKVEIAALPQLFIRGAKWMIEHSAVWSEETVIDRFLAKHPKGRIVFEGAQGMLLDQKRDPTYGTRSSTGMTNVLDALRLVKTSLDLDIYLVTRTYMTRHGDGPMFYESKLPYKNITDPTNPTNPYQGVMRYGYLDMDWYEKAAQETEKLTMKDDPPACLGKINLRTALTCIDQVDEYMPTHIAKSKLIVAKGKTLQPCEVGELPGLGIYSVGRKDTDISVTG
jgi:adenylosuccinate synthase